MYDPRCDHLFLTEKKAIFRVAGGLRTALLFGTRSLGAMLIRLRTKDGLKRVEVGDKTTLAQLQAQIESEFGISVSAQKLSLQARRSRLKPDTRPAFLEILTFALRAGTAS